MLYENNFVEFSLMENASIGLCSAKQEYIPIEDFKEAFLNIAKLAREKELKAIVFDKRNLTIFHQPSMEWYYTEWKKELASFGLTNHYKILPPMPWFEKSVEAGKSEIRKKHKDFDFSCFQVTYIKSPEEAIEKEAEKKKA